MRKLGWTILLFGLLLITGGFWGVFLVFGPWLGWPPGFKLNAGNWVTRPRNYHELFYTQIAGYFGDSRMCGKISNRAVDEELPSMEIKWRVSFQRSECYFDAALKTKDESLCDLAKKVVTVPSNASDVSPSTCRNWLRKSGTANIEATPFFDPSADVMHEMGYRDSDYYEAVKGRVLPPNANLNGEVDWTEFYSYLMNSAPGRQSDFLKRAEALPSFDN